jgi:transmembrane sensor
MEKEQFRQLLDKYLRETISPEEIDLFLRSWQDKEQRADWEEAIAEIWQDSPSHGLSDPEAMQAAFRKIIVGATIIQMPLPAKRIHLRKWAAAAILALLVGAGWLWQSRIRQNDAIVSTTSIHNDMAPGHSGAILTLSNGQKIVLDSAQNGVIAQQGAINAIKENGALKYTGRTDQVVYNTVSTDRGRQWQLTLPDGTKVWLNALSSLHYPLAFTSTARIVEITGEAYFEVAHNPKMPFKVIAGDQTIEDIGTHFNINAYRDELAIKTTLIEGSVKVFNGSSSVIIKPGEQASLASGSSRILVSPADVEAAIAWKNGVFELSNVNVASIMRQISRWYDVEVSYRGAAPKFTISGEVPRNLNLSEVLKVLALSGVRCELEGRKLTVLSD